MKIIFLGTPDFALPSLEAVAARHEIAGVVCQPDRPKGRELKLVPPPVKVKALALGLPVFQFEKIREEAPALRVLGADIMVTCAYGQILTREILDVCPHGVINVHGSLLPKYRGAAPVQWAVIRGERETGVTVMQTALGLDCGEIILAKRTQIGETESAGELFGRLAALGAEALIEALGRIEAGTAIRTPQNEAEATRFPMLKKEDGRIDFGRDARSIVNLVRGVNPWPGAYADLGGERIKVYSARGIDYDGPEPAGTVLAAPGLSVRCADGAVRLLEVQRPGSRRMSDEELQRGRPVPAGTRAAAGGEAE